MRDIFLEKGREKNQFRSYYCLECKQKKSCQLFGREYCCSCAYQIEQKKTEEYSNYEKVLESKQKEKQVSYKQLQLLKNYLGCRQCGSKEVDAYELWENNQLVCWFCLIKKESRGSSPISFLEQQKWYKKFWKIELKEYLTTNCLPINANCAKKWLKDNQHLNNCQCLEQEARELVELFTSSLQKKQGKLKKCVCETSKKVRVDYLDSAGNGWIECQICEKSIAGAGHHGVIKNRNNPKFWGLKVKEKVLCGNCLKNLAEKMPTNKKYTFNKYVKRGYWK